MQIPSVTAERYDFLFPFPPVIASNTGKMLWLRGLTVSSFSGMLKQVHMRLSRAGAKRALTRDENFWLHYTAQVDVG